MPILDSIGKFEGKIFIYLRLSWIKKVPKDHEKKILNFLTGDMTAYGHKDIKISQFAYD